MNFSISNQNPSNVVGRTLKQIRRQQGLTQDQLSGKLARFNVILDRSAISRIESQKRIVMDIELMAISKALNVKVESLLFPPEK